MKKNIAFLIFLGLVGAFIWINYSSSRDLQTQEKNNNEKIEVKTVVAEKTSIKDIREYSGIIEGRQEAELAPKILGQLSNLYFNIGDQVKKGQLIAVVDGLELIAQKDLSAQQARGARKSTEETEDYYDQLVEEARENLDLAEDAFETAEDSKDQQAEDSAESEMKKAKEAVESAKKLRDMQVQLSQNQQEVANSQLKVANVLAENRNIYAPFSGVITTKHANIGSIVSPQKPVVSIVQPGEKQISVLVPGEIASVLEKNEQVEIFKKTGQTISGTINAIGPASHGITRKSQVEINIPESSDLKLGEFVNVRFQLDEKGNVVVLPLNSIRKEYHEEFIFVVIDGKAEKRKVKLGVINDDKVEIVSGIKKGESVVVEGQTILKDDQLISSYE